MSKERGLAAARRRDRRRRTRAAGPQQHHGLGLFFSCDRKKAGTALQIAATPNLRTAGPALPRALTLPQVFPGRRAPELRALSQVGHHPHTHTLRKPLFRWHYAHPLDVCQGGAQRQTGPGPVTADDTRPNKKKKTRKKKKGRGQGPAPHHATPPSPLRRGPGQREEKTTAHGKTCWGEARRR